MDSSGDGDFERLVHGIRRGKERENPLAAVGVQHSIHDFGRFEFPRHLNGCQNCQNPGTCGPPLRGVVQGSTVKTSSVVTATSVAQSSQIRNDPANNLRITPTASACSSCHDKGEDRLLMEQNGA